MFAVTRLTLARQFLLVSFLILLTGMVVIGLWVARQIETGVINRTAGVTALYVDSFISPNLQDLAQGGHLADRHLQALQTLLRETPLGQRFVAFNIWGTDGRVLYSNNPMLIGRVFPMRPSLARAISGKVNSEISSLGNPENEYERKHWSKLMETYAPIHDERTGSVVAVSEFYQTTDELVQEVRAAQWRSWIVVGGATLVMYLLLAGLVGRASRTITTQQRELKRKVAQLEELLAQNQRLHERVRRAAMRATALNERFLRRISAHLHDGLAQDLSLALLRMDALAADYRRSLMAEGRSPSANSDFDTVHSALQSALTEIRSVSAGLRLPELDGLSPADTTERAVHDYERKTGHPVTLALDDLPASAPLPIRITLYRVLQESLANGYRHAGAADQRVYVAHVSGQLAVRITDNGKGFDPRAVDGDAHLGLAAMRERVEILGGNFEVESETGRGTTVWARLPLAFTEVDRE
ncbi:MAG: sensor histidine kinase [Candidatus Lambdaproteobacteria bacterium]|nr:sensor histidine kinase [Candidatus Lambdaproteobacteria bacterium]